MATPLGTHERPSRMARFLIVVALLAVGTVSSIGWNLLLPGFASGLRGHDDNSLSTLVTVEQGTVRERFGFAAYVHDLARGGSVIVPSTDKVSVVLAENLSQVDVVVENYGYSLSGDGVESLPAERVVVGKGQVAPDGDVVSYTFLMADDGFAASLVYFEVGESVVMVDRRLVDP